MKTITSTPERMLGAAIARLRIANGAHTERCDYRTIAGLIDWHCLQDGAFPERLTVGGETAQRLAPTLMEMEVPAR